MTGVRTGENLHSAHDNACGQATCLWLQQGDLVEEDVEHLRRDHKVAHSRIFFAGMAEVIACAEEHVPVLGRRKLY